MKWAGIVAALLLGLSSVARADRYEAAISVQPHGGLAWVREEGASAPERVPGGGAVMRMSYGLRDWLAVDGELGIATLGAATFDDVEVSIGGAPASPQSLTRTTQSARFLLGANLRLGVAWIPTFSLGLGAQLRRRGDANVSGSDLVPVGREGGISVDPVVAVRAGIERRLNARWLVGASVGLSRAVTSPAIDSAEVAVVVSRCWYPSWGP